MKFVTAHLCLIPSYIFDTRDVTVDDTLKFVNTKPKSSQPDELKLLPVCKQTSWKGKKFLTVYSLKVYPGRRLNWNSRHVFGQLEK